MDEETVLIFTVRKKKKWCISNLLAPNNCITLICRVCVNSRFIVSKIESKYEVNSVSNMQYRVLLTHLKLLVDVPCVLQIAIPNRNYIKNRHCQTGSNWQPALKGSNFKMLSVTGTTSFAPFLSHSICCGWIDKLYSREGQTRAGRTGNSYLD